MSTKDREWNKPLYPLGATAFERWYDKNAGSLDGSFTFGEWVWKEARKDLLREQRRTKKQKSN